MIHQKLILFFLVFGCGLSNLVSKRGKLSCRTLNFTIKNNLYNFATNIVGYRNGILFQLGTENVALKP